MHLSRRYVWFCSLAVLTAPLPGCHRPERVRYVYLTPPLPPPDSVRVSWSQAPAASTQIPAGELAGLVVDDASGQPLYHAQVHVVSTSVGALSDSTGRFRLKLPPGGGSIRVVRIGYSNSVAEIAPHVDSGYVMVAALARSQVRLCDVTVGHSAPQSAVVISVRDALTGRPPTGTMTVTVTDTAAREADRPFRESFTVVVDSLGHIARPIAPARLGTYAVSLRSDGYKEWRGAASTRPVPGCGGFASAVFRVWLVPQ